MNRAIAVVLSLFLAVPGVRAEPIRLSAPLLEPLVARPIGPANMGGRITDLAVVERRPSTFYVASASGGLWKTVNNGITWTPVFERATTVSLGAVAVSLSNPDVVWVGTGEANARNSVSWGDGVYRSTDGGKTWVPRGLRDTQHIGRVVIHPRTPDVVYVAALGHLWAPNRERGVFKTEDGGKTWRQALQLDAETGCIDLVMDPTDPETLYAAGYRVRRDAFAGPNPMIQFGAASGLYRTRDGGKTWTRLTRGLPDRPLGRCGLAVWRKDPGVLYAVIQTDRTDIRTVSGQRPATSDKPDNGGVFRSTDRGETWTKLNDLCPRPFYFGQIRIDPNDQKRLYVLGVRLFVSEDGGRTFRDNGARGVHADHHALWIDPTDTDHLVLGGDGGLYLSHDRGTHWEHVRNLPLAQFYAVAVDMQKPYRVYGGLQDNGTWGGPSRTRSPEGITVADWVRILSADGFHCQVDPTDPSTVFAEGQYGMLRRINVRSGEQEEIRPDAPRLSPAYRFNWSAPLLLSPHNPHTVYYGGNHLFRSTNRGDRWERISTDLTRGKPGWSANRGHTLTTIAESPVKAGLLYVGTDDGNVAVTHDGGRQWYDVSARLPEVADDRCITRVECSSFVEGSAWLTLDRHRNDDRAPYVFRTEDQGFHWKSLTANLPKDGPVHVIRADARNRDLLFVGTEFGLFASINGGASWEPLRHGLPTVAVHDLVIHPRDRELVIATHGRGIYILDVAPLQEMTAKVLQSSMHLFDVKPVTSYESRGRHGLVGGKTYTAPNPPYGAVIYYYLKEKPSQAVRLTLLDALGNAISELPTTDKPGLHRAHWDLRKRAGINLLRGAPEVLPGEYAVRLKVGELAVLKKFRIEAEE